MKSILSKEIKHRGWAYVDKPAACDALLELASELGRPIPNLAGHLIQSLEVRAAEEAKAGTLSHRYGKSSFPLHTDTAFWSVPAHYLLMWVEGDRRRATTVSRFDTIFSKSSRIANSYEHGIWRVTAGRIGFYTSMYFTRDDMSFRYDRDCMAPVNSAAKEFDDGFRAVEQELELEHVDWTLGRAVIIDNWRAAHGRAAGPIDEGSRILHRIYVE